MNDKNSPYLMEPAVSGCLFGAVAAGRVVHRDGRDYLLSPDSANWGADLDVTEYVAKLAEAGYIVAGDMRATNHSYTVVDGTRWKLTGDGEIKASEYALTALNNPEVLHMRSAWAAMSGALYRLARHEEPTLEQLAEVGPAHATYLLGHHVLHSQVATAYERHQRAVELMSGWVRSFGNEDGLEQQTWQAYRILAFLRGEDLATLDSQHAEWHAELASANS